MKYIIWLFMLLSLILCTLGFIYDSFTLGLTGACLSLTALIIGLIYYDIKNSRIDY